MGREDVLVAEPGQEQGTVPTVVPSSVGKIHQRDTSSFPMSVVGIAVFDTPFCLCYDRFVGADLDRRG